MASFEIIGDESTFIQYDTLGTVARFEGSMFDSQIEETILEMLNSSTPLLVSSMQSTLRSIIKSGNSGAINNLKAHEARKTKDGAYIVTVTTRGRTDNYYYNRGRRVHVYHDDALKWLEYGREGQPPRPWVEKATRHAENAVLAKMQSVYDSKMGK